MTNSSKPNTDRQFIARVISAYLQAKPFFYIFIRPQEALFFHRHQNLIKPPVLDFGCGDGFFARLAFKTKLDYGLDLPHTGIESPSAKQVYRQRLIYDGGRIPLKTNSVQTIVSNCVFEHIYDINLSFQEMYRVLKPGGFILTTVMTNVWEDNLLGKKILGPVYARWLSHRQVHRNLFTHRQWADIATKHHFNIQTITGYLNRSMAHSLEMHHYSSVFGIPAHRLTGQWYPLRLIPMAITHYGNHITGDQDINLTQAAALQLVLQKN